MDRIDVKPVPPFIERNEAVTSTTASIARSSITNITPDTTWTSDTVTPVMKTTRTRVKTVETIAGVVVTTIVLATTTTTTTRRSTTTPTDLAHTSLDKESII
jgi:hypothetical protein